MASTLARSAAVGDINEGRCANALHHHQQQRQEQRQHQQLWQQHQHHQLQRWRLTFRAFAIDEAVVQAEPSTAPCSHAEHGRVGIIEKQLQRFFPLHFSQNVFCRNLS